MESPRRMGKDDGSIKSAASKKNGKKATPSYGLIDSQSVKTVIENINERIEALQGAYSLAQELLVVSVMLANQNATKGKPFNDGILQTSHGTVI